MLLVNATWSRASGIVASANDANGRSRRRTETGRVPSSCVERKRSRDCLKLAFILFLAPSQMTDFCSGIGKKMLLVCWIEFMFHGTVVERMLDWAFGRTLMLDWAFAEVLR